MEPKGWNGGLDTGHDAVDEQHRDLFRLHAEALTAARGGDGSATEELLHELMVRTAEHFAFEERMMAESSFPSREPHADAHRAFMGDVVALVAEASRDASSGLVRLWLESRYAAWWKLHLRTNDVALAKHLRAVAALAPAAAPAPPKA